MERKYFILLLALALVTVSFAACSQEVRWSQKEIDRLKQSSINANRKAISPSVTGRPHFDYDRYDVRPDAEAVLSRVAKYLKDYPGIRVEIQGHCDERGTVEYNYQLGLKRAESVKKFLARQGVASDRMETNSYGKAKPLMVGSSKKSWAENRRVEFMVISR